MDPVRHVASWRRFCKTRETDTACFHPHSALTLVTVSTPLRYFFSPYLGQKCAVALPKLVLSRDLKTLWSSQEQCWFSLVNLDRQHHNEPMNAH